MYIYTFIHRHAQHSLCLPSLYMGLGDVSGTYLLLSGQFSSFFYRCSALEYFTVIQSQFDGLLESVVNIFNNLLVYMFWSNKYDTFIYVPTKDVDIFCLSRNKSGVTLLLYLYSLCVLYISSQLSVKTQYFFTNKVNKTILPDDL